MEKHVTDIAAIIGGLYIVARAIVYMTPTPKDDEALKKIGKWLKLIAWATGLDLKKGIEKYKDK